jgi:hypothetical protein
MAVSPDDRNRFNANQQALELAKTEEVTIERLDEMATRLFNQIQRHITILEKSEPDGNEAKLATNARSLATLQQTLGKAILLKRDRDARKETKSSKKHVDARGTIKRKLSRRAAAKSKG